jgi:hypothetical protein
MTESQNSTPLPEQVSTLFKQLVSSAAELNTATEEFSKTVAPLDVSLQKLNVGIECWVPVQRYDEPSGEFEVQELGYARINRVWGIALRVRKGHSDFPDREDEETWRFNEGPRRLRIDAVDALPELLERLIKKADATTRKVRESTLLARDVAKAIRESDADTAPKRKK